MKRVGDVSQVQRAAEVLAPGPPGSPARRRRFDFQQWLQDQTGAAGAAAVAAAAACSQLAAAPSSLIPIRFTSRIIPPSRPSVPPPPPRQATESRASTELSSGQAPRHCHPLAGLFFSTPFPELWKEQALQFGSLGVWVKHPCSSKAATPMQQVACPQGLATSPTCPQAPTSFPSNLQQSWPQAAVEAVLSRGAHLLASACPRAGIGFAGGLTGLASPHGPASTLWPLARPSPRQQLATHAPAPRPAGAG